MEQYYNVRPAYAHYSYYPPPLHSQNPNPPLPNHQILLPPHHTPTLLPPGVDSYATSSSCYHHPYTHVNGYEAQPSVVNYGNVQYSHSHESALPTSSYYQDPSISQIWVSEGAGIPQYGAHPPQSVDYSAAVNPLNTNFIYPTDPNNLSSQPLPNDANQNIPKEPEVLQSLRCEVCKIECNSKDILDQHMLGKKHRKNMWLQEELSRNFIPPAIASIPKEIKKTKKAQMGEGPSALAFGKDLETKRQKLLECGAAVGSVLLCSMCNVVCNSQIVFLHHLNGKQHAAQVGMRASSTVGPSKSVPDFQNKTVAQIPLNKSKRKGVTIPKIVQSAWCEICSVDCVSQDVLEKHKIGKKHQKKLEMLYQPAKVTSTPASSSTQITSNQMIGPQENPSSNDGNTDINKKGKKKPASAPVEDVEYKRQKVVSSGTATEAVRVCAICNVVCNSQTVFNYHLSGKQHATMMKKHAEAAGTTTPGTQVR
ncbi:hypothetical protein FRX31_008892 [Thalictrum thalictroides]|uniref:Zinc finger protein n=1 Tax=Thalictrum thalictroides TaxID=46969 RepID=A0A7J6WZH8_THATH|nr:hypothetical protein FRX31_008892 [Thalictrum thalictroides]